MTEQLEIRPSHDVTSPTTSGSGVSRWQKIRKQYFKKIPAKLCYIENDTTVRGSPLWPKDSTFDSAKIARHLVKTKAILEKLGGQIFSGHIKLNSDRSLSRNSAFLLDRPERLATTFVSGFLIPTKKILDSSVGFFPSGGKIPALKKVVAAQKGTWLFTNLGYFLTKRLIVAEKNGGLDYSHNSRFPADQYLDPKDNSYLGGYLLRQRGQEIAFPPPYSTGGVGITSEGRPVLIENVKLAGGTLSLAGKKIRWTAKDVNPAVVGLRPLALYTPGFATPDTEKAIKSGDWKNYKTIIGDGRVNVVVVNRGTGEYPVAKVAYVVDGALGQPASGLVLSFAKEFFARQFKKSPQGAKIAFDCDPWFAPKLWQQLTTFYEGLMPLNPEGPQEFGPWLHPHSALTQETYIPNFKRREPRIALVQTKSGFGAVAFSGRYEFSLGISFAEMAGVITSLFQKMAPQEKIEKIMSLDGGSGAKLCLIENGKAYALNWVAPGPRNPLGDPQGNTYSGLSMRVG